MCSTTRAVKGEHRNYPLSHELDPPLTSAGFLTVTVVVRTHSELTCLVIAHADIAAEDEAATVGIQATR